MSDPTNITMPDFVQRLMERRGITLGGTYGTPIGPENNPAIEARKAWQERQEARRTARWAERMPATYRNATLDDFTGKDRRVADYWITHRNVLTLVLAGGTGAGKTHLAYAIGSDLIARGATVEAWTVHDLLDAKRPDGDRYGAERAERANILILDDLGATKDSAWAVDELTALIDSRVRNRRRTIVTTNLRSRRMKPDEPAGLREIWGARLVDRLNEDSMVHTFTGASRRKPAAIEVDLDNPPEERNLRAVN